jgi:type III pantothenate kinase
MILLIDIGNTNTHLGLASNSGVTQQSNIPTPSWSDKSGVQALRRFGGARIGGVSVCSVVPAATPAVVKAVRQIWSLDAHILNSQTLRGVGIEYPRPKTIGPDRLANAVAVKFYFGAPSVVVDFGTAVTFDVVDRRGNYVGGIIAPGLAAMTDYLHERTALLPRIRIREVRTSVGKSTKEAMLIGAVHGYRGLVHGLLVELKKELKTQRLPVVATGGYAELIAAKMPEISAVDPTLTLEGLRLEWLAHNSKQNV